MPIKLQKLPAALRWGLAALCAAVCGVLWAYYWRVFFGLDNRVSPLVVTLGCAAFLEVCLLAGYCVRRFAKGFAAKGAVCIFLCGLLFAFANPPLQTPDEADHYLRTYAISTGHFDFDASRTYPDDVAYLLEAFPGAWVNAHTSAGVGTDPDTGAKKAYNTAGYALKQYGKDGAVQSMADSFALYLAHDVRDSVPDPVSEPVSFLVIPFLPGAVGMALARLLGFGALGCLYGGRIVNLLAYTLLCALALAKAERYRPAFAAIMLLPMSLFMGASLSYDATLLGCYYLMLALLTRKEWDTQTAGIYTAACIFVNIAKPYLNLLWVLPIFLVAKREWHAKGRRPLWALGSFGGAMAVTLLTEWYGTAFRYSYPIIERQGGSTVNGGEQLAFALRNPLRTIAAFWGTLGENDFFIGQLGLFGWKDLPISFLNLTSPLVLLLAALLAAAQQNAPMRSPPAAAWAGRRCWRWCTPRCHGSHVYHLYPGGHGAHCGAAGAVFPLRLAGIAARPGRTAVQNHLPRHHGRKSRSGHHPAVRLLCRFWRCAALPALLCGAGVRRIRVSWLTRI